MAIFPVFYSSAWQVIGSFKRSSHFLNKNDLIAIFDNSITSWSEILDFILFDLDCHMNILEIGYLYLFQNTFFYCIYDILNFFPITLKVSHCISFHATYT